MGNQTLNGYNEDGIQEKLLRLEQHVGDSMHVYVPQVAFVASRSTISCSFMTLMAIKYQPDDQVGAIK